MTTVAAVGTLRMAAALARGDSTVMTNAALCGGLIMGERRGHRRPDGSGVAGIA